MLYNRLTVACLLEQKAVLFYYYLTNAKILVCSLKRFSKKKDKIRTDLNKLNCESGCIGANTLVQNFFFAETFS